MTLNDIAMCIPRNAAHYARICRVAGNDDALEAIGRHSSPMQSLSLTHRYSPIYSLIPYSKAARVHYNADRVDLFTPTITY